MGSDGQSNKATRPLKRLVKRKTILSSDDEGEAAAPMEVSGDESGSEFVAADAAGSESESDDSDDAADSEEVFAPAPVHHNQ